MTQQSAEMEILERIRKGKPQPQALPELPAYACPGDPLENFIGKLVGFDGRAIKFGSREEAVKWLLGQPGLDPAKKRIYSKASGVPGNVTEAELADLRNAASIHSCVTEGQLGVGEMGAIWVTNASLGHTVCALLARQLFILLDRAALVGGMHEAYARISLREHQYGSFFTGPSATADIEAVHITGAQGPLGLTALIYNCPDAPAEPVLIVNPEADSSIWIKDELGGQ